MTLMPHHPLSRSPHSISHPSSPATFKQLGASTPSTSSAIASAGGASSSSGPSSASASSASSVTNASTTPSTNSSKRFPCPECGKGFSTAGHLARHARVHSGERNHKCPFPGCETRCSRQDNLQQHYRIHLAPGSRRKRPNQPATDPSAPISATPAERERARKRGRPPGIGVGGFDLSSSSGSSVSPSIAPSSASRPPSSNSSRHASSSATLSSYGYGYGGSMSPPNTPPPLTPAVIPSPIARIVNVNTDGFLPGVHASFGTGGSGAMDIGVSGMSTMGGSPTMRSGMEFTGVVGNAYPDIPPPPSQHTVLSGSGSSSGSNMSMVGLSTPRAAMAALRATQGGGNADTYGAMHGHESLGVGRGQIELAPPYPAPSPSPALASGLVRPDSGLGLSGVGGGAYARPSSAFGSYHHSTADVNPYGAHSASATTTGGYPYQPSPTPPPLPAPPSLPPLPPRGYSPTIAYGSPAPSYTTLPQSSYPTSHSQAQNHPHGPSPYPSRYRTQTVSVPSHGHQGRAYLAQPHSQSQSHQHAPTQSAPHSYGGPSGYTGSPLMSYSSLPPPSSAYAAPASQYPQSHSYSHGSTTAAYDSPYGGISSAPYQQHDQQTYRFPQYTSAYGGGGEGYESGSERKT